ncbi:MAG: type IV toxin-antitoxin system AbiEi family antitoxin domain-containing protein [Planctomycetes bacterium]|nr:type IV toxin-antitoxin system AbiEi family antitoxin domain-containing protein [Planctomycetota bacterium]
MNLEELLGMVAAEPVFRTGFLAAAGEGLPALRLQLSRWAKAGKLLQLKRGLYVLAEPYRRVNPHPFVLANEIKRASYVSLHSALWHFGLIPEHVPTVTSVTTQRPERLETPLGRFVFRHIKRDWFYGCEWVELGSGQSAFVATPEKALLDLVYLTPEADTPGFFAELRLQNIDKLDLNTLRQLSPTSKSGKLHRAVHQIERLVEQEMGQAS